MQRMRFWSVGLAVLILPLPVWAASQWLIAPKTEIVNVGQALEFEMVKPKDNLAWPDTLNIKLSAGGESEEVVLSLKGGEGDDAQARTYSGVPSKAFAGVVRAELQGQASNRILLLASTDGENGPVVVTEEAAKTAQVKTSAEGSSSAGAQVLIAAPEDEPALSANEPIYFLVGSSHERGADARFQISFKYRPFEPLGSVSKAYPFLSNLYFAYTQNTVWDLGGESSPFRDTSYKPSLYYRWVGQGRGLWPDEWRGGLEHESNGQGGVESRSLNIAFIRPSWHWDTANGRRLTFYPKIYQYLDKDDNRDIQRYRGYVDWQLRYGRDDGLMLMGLYRQGTGGYATGQLDLSYPLSDRVLSRMGTFVHLQLFSGYGETLLDYNRERDTQLRLGISVTR